MTPHRSFPTRRAARGISLIASLVLLALTSLLAVGALRTVAVQTRITGATADRGLAFQAAEAAIREAERDAVDAAEASFTASCANGRCNTPSLANTPRWQDSSFTAWRSATVAVPTGAPAASAFAESLGESPNWLGCESEVPRQPNCSTSRFRVTARSAEAGRAAVMLQSHVAAN
jgi:type IV pilus assembly protein PilX